MHARLKPMGHRFSYRVMSLLIDLDRLDDGGPAVAAVRRQPGGALQLPRGRSRRARRILVARYAERCAAEHGIDLTGGRVLLLCYPRLLGYTFNPLSVYFCYRADGELALDDLRGPQHLWRHPRYVLPVTPGEQSSAGIRQSQDKLFYVSPFVEMAMRYHFRVMPPGERVKLRILATDREGPLLAATFNGRRARSTRRRCCGRSSRCRWSP